MKKTCASTWIFHVFWIWNLNQRRSACKACLPARQNWANLRCLSLIQVKHVMDAESVPATPVLVLCFKFGLWGLEAPDDFGMLRPWVSTCSWHECTLAHSDFCLATPQQAKRIQLKGLADLCQALSRYLSLLLTQDQIISGRVHMSLKCVICQSSYMVNLPSNCHND